jgi:O-antigen/teichoic acid export membrane protein
LCAYEQIPSYVAATLVSTFVNLVALVALVLNLGLRGAILHVAIGPWLQLIVLTVLAERKLPDEARMLSRWPLEPARAAIKELLSFAVYTLSTTLIYYLAQVAGRSVVLHRLGAETNGLLQAAVALAAYMRTLVSNGLSVDLYPNAARVDRDPARLSRMLREAQRFCLTLALTGAGVLTLFGDFALRLLYSREFTPAAALLPAYLAGEILRVLGTAAVLVMVAQRKFVHGVAPIVASELTFIVLLALGIHRGVDAYAAAWLAGGALGFTVAMIAFRSAFGKVDTVFTVVAFAAPMALLALPYVPSSPWLRVAIACMLVLLAWTKGLEPAERQSLLRRIPLVRRTA